MIKNFYVEEVKNKESTEEFTSNEIMFSYNITSEEYQILSKKLNIKEQRLRDTINEEVFTPRMTKSDWEIYKIYYPKLNYEKDEDGNDIKSTMNAELIPLVVLYKDDQIVLLQEKYTQELEAFITSYLETQTSFIDNRNFLLVIFHHVVQMLYKHIRFLIAGHDLVETLLHKSKNNNKLIDLVEIEQGFAIFNLALRNIDFIVDNIDEDEEFAIYSEYLLRIQQEINFTIDLSSTYVEICKTTRETYSSYIANDMNVTMKFLAAITIIATIPNAIFGFYGMNIKLPFMGDTWVIFMIIGLVMVLVYVMWRILKRRKLM